MRIFLFIFTILSLSSFSKENTFKFHKAGTDLEKLAQKILLENDLNLIECLSIFNSYPKRNGKILERKPNRKLFNKCNKYITEDLMRKVSKVERDECNKLGGFEEGYICSSVQDYNSITCSQDIISDDIFFKTMKINNNEIKIIYITFCFDFNNTKKLTEEKSLYFKKENKNWKLNNTNCTIKLFDIKK